MGTVNNCILFPFCSTILHPPFLARLIPTGTGRDVLKGLWVAGPRFLSFVSLRGGDVGLYFSRRVGSWLGFSERGETGDELAERKRRRRGKCCQKAGSNADEDGTTHPADTNSNPQRSERPFPHVHNRRRRLDPTRHEGHLRSLGSASVPLTPEGQKNRWRPGPELESRGGASTPQLQHEESRWRPPSKANNPSVWVVLCWDNRAREPPNTKM